MNKQLDRPISATEARPRKSLASLDAEVRNVNQKPGDDSSLCQAKRIAKAFAALESKGYFTAMHFQCCQSCGWGAVPLDAEKAVFYHDQDNYAFESQDEPDYNISGKLRHKLHLAWSVNAKEIIEALADQGLETEWDGSDEHRIAILPLDGKDNDESTKSSQQAE